MRQVNLYVFKRKFRCEDVSVALRIFSQGFFLFKFDLKSGYHHVEIFPDHRKYLAFFWDFGDGVVKYFQFTVLSFGLSSAPYLFTKLLKPILTEGDMGVYGIAVLGFFSYGISVILILTCGIAVSSSSAVCGFSSFWLTVFGEIRLFTVLRYRLFALSFRYNTQSKTQYDIKVNKS